MGNEPMASTFLGNPLWNWLMALGWALGAYMAGKVLYWLTSNLLRRAASRTATRLDDILISVLNKPVVVLASLVGSYLAYHQLEVPHAFDTWADRLFKVTTVLTLTWLVVRLLDMLVQEYLVPQAQRDESAQVRSQLVPVVRSAVKVLGWGLGGVLALNNAGYNVSALLAGIGIGGLAMAMAAKDTVANIFGGVTVFADKPFRVGQRIRVSGYDGTVEEIGIRSTRIRTLEGPIVIVPNFKFTDSLLENVTEEPSRRVRHELGVVYETPPAKLEEAIALLNRLVDDHQDLLEQERVVSFTEFREYSLVIVFAYYIRKDADIFKTQTRIHIELMRRFAAAGIEFAYPTAVEIPGEVVRK